MVTEEFRQQADDYSSKYMAQDYIQVSYGSFLCGVECAAKKLNEQFWSYANIEKIIMTYQSFPDRSCPSELVKKTIEKLKH